MKKVIETATNLRLRGAPACVGSCISCRCKWRYNYKR